MNDLDPNRTLELLDTDGDTCGCGGCGCGGSADQTPTKETDPKESTMPHSTESYAVTGMTCGHCASTVTSKLKALDGVVDVHVEVVAGGTSTVTVASSAPLERADVAAAIDEAGYQLA